MRDLGWSDEAIYSAISVVALSNFYNRWVTASGVHAVPLGTHHLHSRRLAGMDQAIAAR